MWLRICLLISANLLLLTASRSASVDQGKALFTGQRELSGQIRGHDDMLPPEAVRCTNCHQTNNANRLMKVPAPRITEHLLLETQSRRGGPPSHYTQPAFCHLLRTGADPANVLIAREMPVYKITDADCASLWEFFLAKTPPAQNDAR